MRARTAREQKTFIMRAYFTQQLVRTVFHYPPSMKVEGGYY